MASGSDDVIVQQMQPDHLWPVGLIKVAPHGIAHSFTQRGVLPPFTEDLLQPADADGPFKPGAAWKRASEEDGYPWISRYDVTSHAR